MAESFANLKLSEAVMTNEGTRVVLVGKTGSGKSTLGNILLQKKHVYAEDQGKQADNVPDSSETGFVVADGFDSETKECDFKIADNAWGRTMKVVDTPGLFDTSEDLGNTLRKLTDVISLSCPGPHAILFVTRCDVKFTAEENEALQKIFDTFQDKVKNFLVLVFTHGEAIKHTTIEKKLKSAPETLKKVMEIVKTNYTVISQTEDESRTRQEVDTLLSKIDCVSKHGELFYVNDNCKKVTQIMTEAIEKIKKERDVTWSEAEYLAKKGLVFEKEQRWKDTKMAMLIAVLFTPAYYALIGYTGGALAAAGLTEMTDVEALLVGTAGAGAATFINAKLAELATYLKEKKRATGKCVIA